MEIILLLITILCISIMFIASSQEREDITIIFLFIGFFNSILGVYFVLL